MSEFGCLLVGTPTLRIWAGGREVFFEDHPYCGPMPTTKAGVGRDLAPAHPFWSLVTSWYAKGKPIDENGWCKP